MSTNNSNTYHHTTPHSQPSTTPSPFGQPSSYSSSQQGYCGIHSQQASGFQHSPRSHQPQQSTSSSSKMMIPPETKRLHACSKYFSSLFSRVKVPAVTPTYGAHNSHPLKCGTSKLGSGAPSNVRASSSCISSTSARRNHSNYSSNTNIGQATAYPSPSKRDDHSNNGNGNGPFQPDKPTSNSRLGSGAPSSVRASSSCISSTSARRNHSNYSSNTNIGQATAYPSPSTSLQAANIIQQERQPANTITVTTINVLHQAFYDKYADKDKGEGIISQEERDDRADMFFVSEVTGKDVDVVLLQEWSGACWPRLSRRMKECGYTIVSGVASCLHVGCAIAFNRRRWSQVGDCRSTSLDPYQVPLGKEVTSVLLQSIQDPNLKVCCVSLHAPFAKTPSERTGALSRGLDKLLSVKGRYIIGGDFNADADGSTGILDYFRTPESKNGPGSNHHPVEFIKVQNDQRTCLTPTNSATRIDHFFHTLSGVSTDAAPAATVYPASTEGLIPHRTENRQSTFFSDHAAVTATFKLI